MRGAGGGGWGKEGEGGKRGGKGGVLDLRLSKGEEKVGRGRGEGKKGGKEGGRRRGRNDLFSFVLTYHHHISASLEASWWQRQEIFYDMSLEKVFKVFKTYRVCLFISTVFILQVKCPFRHR